MIEEVKRQLNVRTILFAATILVFLLVLLKTLVAWVVTALFILIGVCVLIGLGYGVLQKKLSTLQGVVAGAATLMIMIVLLR